MKLHRKKYIEIELMKVKWLYESKMLISVLNNYNMIN